jgi:predicted metalloendopeptidase
MKTYKNKTIKNRTRKISLTSKKYKISAQDDFYGHVNHLWIKRRNLSKDKTLTFDATITKKVNHEMKNIVLPKLLEEKTKDGEQIRNIYNSSIHWNDDISNKKIKVFVEKLNESRKKCSDVYEFMGWFVKEGFGFPIGWEIEINAQKTHEYISHLAETGITFMNKEFYSSKDKKYRVLRRMYLAFLKKNFETAFGVENNYNVSSIFEIEKKLSESLLPYKDVLYIKNTFNFYSGEKCLEETGLDWNKFSKAIGFKVIPKNLIIENPTYVKNVAKMLKEWNSDEWNNYWVYQILIVASKYNKTLSREFLHFFNKVNETPELKTNDMKKIALSNVETFMNSCISKKYIEMFKNEKEIDYTKKLATRFRNALTKRLTENTWLHSNTKNRSIKKLENMTIITGYKDTWEADPDLDYSSTDGWENYSLFNKWSINRDIQSVGKHIKSKNIWIQMEDQNVYDVNAYYNSLENELVFPNAILQAPFVDIEKDFTYNLASIGATIGHEMLHAFDDDGYYYDENGVYIENGWWNESDKKTYEIKQKNIIKQYEDSAKLDKFVIDGSLTLTENIADIGGLLLSEAVLTEYLNEKEIYGEQQDKYFKEFYTNYAVNWRSNQSIKVFKRSLKDNEHSYSKYRVNCVLSNSQNFQRIFHVKPGDKMYFQPEDIW